MSHMQTHLGRQDSASCSDVGMSGLSEETRMSLASLCSEEWLDCSSSTRSEGCTGPTASDCCDGGAGNAVPEPPAPSASDEYEESISNMIRLQLLQEQEHTPGAQAGSASLSAGVRMIVVSWLVEVAEEFRLQQETLHLAVTLLDRFLDTSEQGVPRCVLQLLAVACILLAAKEHEVTQPSVQQLCAVAANHFKPHDLLRMERIVLDVLDFRTASPSAYTFMHLLAQACSGCVTPAVLSLAMYLTELAMLEAHSGGYAYSCRAAAALLLAHLSIGDPRQTPRLVWAMFSCLGGFSFASLQACMAFLLQLHHAALHSAAAAAGAAAAGRQHADDLLAPLRAKFGAACWCGVSAVTPLAEVPPVSAWAGS